MKSYRCFFLDFFLKPLGHKKDINVVQSRLEFLEKLSNYFFMDENENYSWGKEMTKSFGRNSEVDTFGKKGPIILHVAGAQKKFFFISEKCYIFLEQKSERKRTWKLSFFIFLILSHFPSLFFCAFTILLLDRTEILGRRKCVRFRIMKII